MRFTKMHGTGNDYIYLDCTKTTPEDLPGLTVRLSHRHFGVGSDGLICICLSDRADFRMRIFNADGSEGEMCGNGIRCLGKFVYEKGMTRSTDLTIETGAGIRHLKLHGENGQVAAVTVDMGLPKVDEKRLLRVGEQDYEITPVSMGNPHVVTFLDEIDRLNLPVLGPGFECHPDFPHRTNTEFVTVLGPAHLRMRVWERGSGETMACGTGACAAAAAAMAAGYTKEHTTVSLPGGDLEIRRDGRDGHLFMTGPAVTVYEGEIRL